MKRVRNSLIVLIAGVALYMVAGCSGDTGGIVNTGEISCHYVDVYLTEGREFRTLDGGGPINEILLFTKDLLVINNPTDKMIEITLPEGVFEEVDDGNRFEGLVGKIPSKKRTILKVIADAPLEATFAIHIEGIGSDGAPTVRVGEEP